MTLITIYTIGAAQGLLLAIALWRKRVNRTSNRILSIWMILLAFDLAIKSVYLNDNHTSLISAYLLTLLFPFLYGSFFYIYVRSLVTNKTIGTKDLIHFAAFIIFFGLNLSVIITPSLFNTQGYTFSDAVLFIYSVAYVVAGLYLVIGYRRNLSQQKVDIEGIDLKWLMIMSYCQVVIWLIGVSQWLLPIKDLNSWSIYVAVSLWIILTGYLSLSQQNLPVIKELKDSETKKYDSDERFEEVAIRLNELIEQKSIHLQPSLTIGILARSSGYPEYLISLFINRVHGMNFRDYINNLRIVASKKMLVSAENKRTILDIAYECGFNSKSTFNSAFKKITGQTPSQFRQAKH